MKRAFIPRREEQYALVVLCKHVSGSEDAGWSRAAQDQAEATLSPDGRSEPTAGASDYMTAGPGAEAMRVFGVIVILALAGVVVGGVVGAVIGGLTSKPNPDAWVSGPGIDAVAGGMVGAIIGAAAFPALWLLTRPLGRLRTRYVSRRRGGLRT